MVVAEGTHWNTVLIRKLSISLFIHSFLFIYSLLAAFFWNGIHKLPDSKLIETVTILLSFHFICSPQMFNLLKNFSRKIMLGSNSIAANILLEFVHIPLYVIYPPNSMTDSMLC